MKKLKQIILFSVFFILTIGTTVAQSKSVGIGACLTSPGYGLNVNYNMQQTDMSNLRAKLTLLQSVYKADYFTTNYNLFYLDIGYYYNVFKNKNRSFIVNVGGSGTASYELINGGSQNLENGDILGSENGFVYGFNVGAESEFYITERLSLFVNLDQYYIINSNINNFNSVLSGGVKLYF